MAVEEPLKKKRRKDDKREVLALCQLSHNYLRVIKSAFCSVVSAGQVTLQPAGPSLAKSVGDIVTVFCQEVGSNNQPTWRDPQTNVISTGGVGGVSVTYISGTNTKLEINPFQESHVGTYTCNSLGSTKSISITAYKKVEFTNAPTEQSFEIYTDARIVCEITSNPSSTYEWKFNGASIPANSKKYTIQEHEYLQVTNISREDDGVYTCQGTVLTGNFDTDSRDITVTVLVPPKIILAPEDFNGTLGKNAQFKCIANGNPQPVYTWEKNNALISYGDRIFIQSGGEVLVINDLRSDDFGSYKCVARVEGLPNRDADHSAILLVFTPPQVQAGTEVTAVENEEVTLKCSVVSGDNSELTWRRFGEDMPLGPQPGSADIEVLSKQNGKLLELKFSSVKRSYNGSYECFAKNAGGEDSEISNLTVNFKPVPDSARNQHEAYTGWIGNPVTLTCYWLANPPAKYFWRIVGQESSNLTAPKFTTSSTNDGASSLTFTPDEPGDFAVYECVAWNTIQLKEMSTPHTVELKSAAPPDAPTVEVIKVSPTEITLQIMEADYDGGLPLTGYNISWKYEFEGNDVTRSAIHDYKDEDVANNEIYIIENLLSAKEYMIAVAAVNDFATGEPSSPEISARTLATSKRLYSVNLVKQKSVQLCYMTMAHSCEN
ncbi:neural cell adhesion molecule 2-like [Anneissia japonica]|uniref:neural cell adhesion molecule 2-like n=1 Tax=Anneissia japonica TaxID=1529436 RepID=UPI00142568B9|nr:neural cell adhesion molecule 2-like [Anneissia japonica]